MYRILVYSTLLNVQSCMHHCIKSVVLVIYNFVICHSSMNVHILYQELMKEGASNCVERHLNLNDCDTSLLWTYSQVGHKCCFHSQRITPRAVRKRTYVYIRRWRVAIVNYDSRSQRWSRNGEGEIERLRKRQATTSHRPAKRSR